MDIQHGTKLRVSAYQGTKYAYPVEEVVFMYVYNHSDIPGSEFVAQTDHGKIVYQFSDIVEDN
jgi:hypothetical protein